jgi:acetyltransferase-like isoleucine patch superfamily enzyme
MIEKLLSFFASRQHDKSSKKLLVNLPEGVSSKSILSLGVFCINSKIDDYSYVARNSNIFNCDIGKYCSVGPNVTVGYGDHPINFVSTSPVFYQSNSAFDLKPEKDRFIGNDKVTIGNDVWIGANVYVKNGVSIADGAVIGSGAVVTKNVEPYSIVGGVPAKFIRFRFSEAQIASLLKIKWWNWERDIIARNLEAIGNDNIDEFIEKFSGSN